MYVNIASHIPQTNGFVVKVEARKGCPEHEASTVSSAFQKHSPYNTQDSI